MKKMYFIIAGAVLLLSLVLLVQFAVRPRPVPKIKLSGFDSPVHLANAVRYRLHEEIKNNPILLLGVTAETPEHFETWKSMLLSLEPELKYSSLLIEAGLPAVEGLEGAQRIKMVDDFEALVQMLQSALQSNTRVALLVPSVYSSMLVSNNVGRRLKENLKVPIMSLSFNWFPRTRDEEANLKPICVGEGVDEQGSGALGCMVLTTSRNLYRTKSEDHPYEGLVNLVGMDDYLVLFRSRK